MFSHVSMNLNSAKSSPVKPPISSDIQPNPNLPARLFSAGLLPDGACMNIYSKPEHLGSLVKILEGSEAWDRLMESQFRNLFSLPVARCFHSAKLIHEMLSRQLVTNKKHELWFVYGGFPIRFSIREFHVITGLRCAPFPSELEVESHQDPTFLSVWNRLFGEKKIVTVSEVVDMLKNDKLAGPSKRFSTWKILSLDLIIIVDGVIVCSNKKAGRVSPRFVEMLHDLDFFMDYPWGRESFNETIRRLGPFTNEPHPFAELKTRLGQHSTCCYGFPLALQLQVCRRIKDPADLRNFIQRPCDSHSSTILLRESDIVDAEFNPKVCDSIFLNFTCRNIAIIRYMCNLLPLLCFPVVCGVHFSWC